jgi:hypothetical protein
MAQPFHPPMGGPRRLRNPQPPRARPRVCAGTSKNAKITEFWPVLGVGLQNAEQTLGVANLAYGDLEDTQLGHHAGLGLNGVWLSAPSRRGSAPTTF